MFDVPATGCWSLFSLCGSDTTRPERPVAIGPRLVVGTLNLIADNENPWQFMPPESDQSPQWQRRSRTRARRSTRSPSPTRSSCSTPPWRAAPRATTRPRRPRAGSPRARAGALDGAAALEPGAPVAQLAAGGRDRPEPRQQVRARGGPAQPAHLWALAHRRRRRPRRITTQMAAAAADARGFAARVADAFVAWEAAHAAKPKRGGRLSIKGDFEAATVSPCCGTCTCTCTYARARPTRSDALATASYLVAPGGDGRSSPTSPLASLRLPPASKTALLAGLPRARRAPGRRAPERVPRRLVPGDAVQADAAGRRRGRERRRRRRRGAGARLLRGDGRDPRARARHSARARRARPALAAAVAPDRLRLRVPQRRVRGRDRAARARARPRARRRRGRGGRAAARREREGDDAAQARRRRLHADGGRGGARRRSPSSTCTSRTSRTARASSPRSSCARKASSPTSSCARAAARCARRPRSLSRAT